VSRSLSCQLFDSWGYDVEVSRGPGGGESGGGKGRRSRGVRYLFVKSRWGWQRSGL